jgi:tetratricopeptide (TPR) repeat protein
MKQVIGAAPNDGDAYFVLSKAQTELKDTASTENDIKAKQLLTMGNRYAKLEQEWGKSRSLGELHLRVEQPQRKDFVSVVLSKRQPNRFVRRSMKPTTFLRRTNTIQRWKRRRSDGHDPSNPRERADVGGKLFDPRKIHLRRADREQALNAFKTAIFWNNNLIDAHVNLGKIYLDRGDCQQARTYATSALRSTKRTPKPGVSTPNGTLLQIV